MRPRRRQFHSIVEGPEQNLAEGLGINFVPIVGTGHTNNHERERRACATIASVN